VADDLSNVAIDTGGWPGVKDSMVGTLCIVIGVDNNLNRTEGGALLLWA
jgi:hypothetical protein